MKRSSISLDFFSDSSHLDFAWAISLRITQGKRRFYFILWIEKSENCTFWFHSSILLPPHTHTHTAPPTHTYPGPLHKIRHLVLNTLLVKIGSEKFLKQNMFLC
jgi:hypothetical protein